MCVLIHEVSTVGYLGRIVRLIYLVLLFFVSLDCSFFFGSGVYNVIRTKFKNLARLSKYLPAF